MRAEWDGLIAELRADHNRNHFVQTDVFKQDFSSHGAGAAASEFLEFLVSSVTAEFSGCVLYAEIKKRIPEGDIHDLFAFMARDEARHAAFINESLKDFGIGVDLSFLTKTKKYTYFQAEIHLLRDVSVGEDRLCALHHHLPPFAAPSGPGDPSDFQLVRELVR